MHNLEVEVLTKLNDGMSYRGIIASFHGKHSKRAIDVAFHGLELQDLISVEYECGEIHKVLITEKGQSKIA
ncbi:MAG: hypothetical protein ACRDDL_05150 [Sarcina sp.]